MPTLNAWYALQIQPNHERIAATVLRAKGYNVLFPTYVVRSVNNNSKENRERPLFPGYLFCELSSGGGGRIVTSPGVTRVVSFGGRWAPVEDGEIHALQQISASPVFRQPWHYLPVGHQVRIESGPLKGIVGILASNGNRLVVNITLLQRSISVTLDDMTVVSSPSHPRHSDLSEESRVAVALTVSESVRNRSSLNDHPGAERFAKLAGLTVN